MASLKIAFDVSRRFSADYEFTAKDEARIAQHRHYIGELQRKRRHPNGFIMNRFTA